MLKDINSSKGPKCKYDPNHIISKRRKENKASSYHHYPIELFEKAANLDTWEEARQIFVGR